MFILKTIDRTNEVGNNWAVGLSYSNSYSEFDEHNGFQAAVCILLLEF